MSKRKTPDSQPESAAELKHSELVNTFSYKGTDITERTLVGDVRKNILTYEERRDLLERMHPDGAQLQTIWKLKISFLPLSLLPVKFGILQMEPREYTWEQLSDILPNLMPDVRNQTLCEIIRQLERRIASLDPLCAAAFKMQTQMNRLDIEIPPVSELTQYRQQAVRGDHELHSWSSVQGISHFTEQNFAIVTNAVARYLKNFEPDRN